MECVDYIYGVGFDFFKYLYEIKLFLKFKVWWVLLVWVCIDGDYIDIWVYIVILENGFVCIYYKRYVYSLLLYGI